MPSAETVTLQKAECAYLQVALPGRPVENAGVLLLDPESDRLYSRLRRDWPAIADQEDAEVLALLSDDIARKAEELGGRRFLEYLESNLSNILRVTDREAIGVGSFEARLNRLYQEHVRPTVLRYQTHLPQYSFRAAAGKFGGEMEVEPEDWVEAPANLRLAPDMFAGHVTGRSMEPRIPDGSLCAFRANPQGSRKGKLLLIENFGLPEHGGRYTVKRYHSEKAVTEETWRHTKIRLEPLNPDFEAWELGEGDFRVIAEFVRVLPPVE